MKKVNTTVSTGTKLIDERGRVITIGLYRRGAIEVKTATGPYSGITEQLSARELNKRIREGKYTPLESLKPN